MKDSADYTNVFQLSSRAQPSLLLVSAEFGAIFMPLPSGTFSFTHPLNCLTGTSFAGFCLGEGVATEEEGPLVLPIPSNLSYFHRGRDKFRTNPMS